MSFLTPCTVLGYFGNHHYPAGWLSFPRKEIIWTLPNSGIAELCKRNGAKLSYAIVKSCLEKFCTKWLLRLIAQNTFFCKNWFNGIVWKFQGGDFLGAAPPPGKSSPLGFWIISNSGHLWVERMKIIDSKFFKGGTVKQISIQGGGRPLSFPGVGTYPRFSLWDVPPPPHRPPLCKVLRTKTFLNPIRVTTRG